MGSRVEITVAIFAFFTILVFASASIAAPVAAPADQGKVTLTYDSGKTVACLTPRWASGGQQMQTNGSSGNMVVGGKKIPVAGWKSGSNYRLGLDTNGDGIVNTEEYQKVAASGSVIVTGKIAEQELAIRCSDVSIHYDEKKGEVVNMRWRVQGMYGFVGEIASVKIRIIDEDMNGKYGHDGKDAILIGRSKLALPLRRKHRIGTEFYTLKISPDGSSLEYKIIPDPPVGLVRTPFVGKYLIGLVLDGGNGAFDIQACSRTGIPAGSYQLSYGVVGDPRSPAALYRGRGAVLKYEIEADKKSTLRIGPPLQLVFPADFREADNKPDPADKRKKPAKPQFLGKISVRGPEKVIGAGGEEYGPINLVNIKSPRGRPVVKILQGSRTLVSATMAESNGRLHGFSWDMPRNVSPRGLKVAMMAPISGLGKVMGVRTLKQIYEKEEVAPPATDKPSVTSIPWRRPGKPVRVVKKPKPPIGSKPKPKPVTPPTTTVKPKPPKPVTSAGSDETRAQRLLKLAASYEKMRLKDKYVQMLKKTIEKYPDTKAAVTAKELLTASQ